LILKLACLLQEPVANQLLQGVALGHGGT
ncbi:hypothetical protein LCGC14_3066110, partial [marine sediment metagenome]